PAFWVAPHVRYRMQRIVMSGPPPALFSKSMLLSQRQAIRQWPQAARARFVAEVRRGGADPSTQPFLDWPVVMPAHEHAGGERVAGPRRALDVAGVRQIDAAVFRPLAVAVERATALGK